MSVQRVPVEELNSPEFMQVCIALDKRVNDLAHELETGLASSLGLQLSYEKNLFDCQQAKRKLSLWFTGGVV